jgi:hypothetical protein
MKTVYLDGFLVIGQAGRHYERTADPSTAPLAMKLPEAPLRMTLLMKADDTVPDRPIAL